MILHLRPDSPVPPYEQLRDQIATMVASGAIMPETRLPSIRQLAADRDARLAEAARSYAIAVRQLGATRDQGLEAAGRALAELPEEIQTGA